MQLTTRNATLSDLADLLQQQQAAKLDVVVPARTIRSSGGRLIIPGTGSPTPDPEHGIIEGPGTFTPTVIADGHIAEKLGIPTAYLRTLRAKRIDLYDANVNGWLHGLQTPEPHDVGEPWSMQAEPDSRSFLARCFRGADDDSGIMRALLSNGYGFVDHIDWMTAALEGARESGVEFEIVGCDLSETSMRIRLAVPGMARLAPVLLGNYRSPFDDPAIHEQRKHGADGFNQVRVTDDEINRIRRMAAAEGKAYPVGQEPVLFNGLEITNSETGGGASAILPVFTAEICMNGYRINRHASRKVHLGQRMDDGVVKWSIDTQRKNLDLVTAQARDAVATFLSDEFFDQVVADLEAKAGAPVVNAQETIEVVTRELGFPAERTAAVLDHFIRGGQMTAGGIANAITSVAQTIEDPDTAAEVGNTAIRAMELVSA